MFLENYKILILNTDLIDPSLYKCSHFDDLILPEGKLLVQFNIIVKIEFILIQAIVIHMVRIYLYCENRFIIIFIENNLITWVF